jgi:hypothetical protein
MSAEVVEVADASHFRILISSDVHLGYGEKNQERAEDTFNTFSEVDSSI